MESTGVHWIPVFQTLEARGFDVLLANACEVKHPARPQNGLNDCTDGFSKFNSLGVPEHSYESWTDENSR
jgi:transposase